MTDSPNYKQNMWLARDDQNQEYILIDVEAWYGGLKSNKAHKDRPRKFLDWAIYYMLTIQLKQIIEQYW